jgi:probable rRNA maturation factor
MSRAFKLTLQYAASGFSRDALPSKADFQKWVAAAYDGKGEVTIRLADADEIQALNRDYRSKDAPTNVLSFPYESGGKRLSGDLALCPQVVLREAEEQGKPPAAHWAHLTIHGILHLCGFDHIDDDEAAIMESREREILARLGYPDPYA